jgi:hypothetical protein
VQTREEQNEMCPCRELGTQRVARVSFDGSLVSFLPPCLDLPPFLVQTFIVHFLPVPGVTPSVQDMARSRQRRGELTVQFGRKKSVNKVSRTTETIKENKAND